MAVRKQAKAAVNNDGPLEDTSVPGYSFIRSKLNYKGKAEPEVFVLIGEDGIVGAEHLDEAADKVQELLDYLK